MTELAVDPNSDVRRCILSLGSNMGDRLENLQEAVDSLLEAPGLSAVAVSPVYETAPVGVENQPNFYNAVLVVDTFLSARVLLERAQSLELALGRVREERWGPRTIDVDIVHLEGSTENESDLQVPHPRAHERAFVLAPWRDVDPDAVLPGKGTVRELLEQVGEAGVQRRDDLRLRVPL